MSLPRALWAASVLASCGPSVVPSGRPAPHPIAHSPRPERPAPIPALAAHEVTRVPADSFGPYLATNATHRVVVWALPEQDGKRALQSVSLTDTGASGGEPARIGETAADLELAALRSTRADGASFAFVTSTSTHSIDAWLLGAQGEFRAGPIHAGQANDKVYWVDAVATPSSLLLFWAAQRGDDRADVFAAAIRAGKVSPATEVAHDAKAWQAAPLGDGAAVGIVRATLAQSEPGPVDLVFTDASGKPRNKPISVSAAPTAALDLDLVSIGDRVILAWTDMRDIEGRLVIAAIRADGSTLRAPAPATTPFGEQALVRLAAPFAGGKTAYVAWEQTLERPASGRLLRVAPLADDGSLREERATLIASSDPDQPLELRASEHGVAMLTNAPACPRGAPCDGSPWVPTFAELDDGMAGRASEPLRLADLDGKIATSAWDLSCGTDGCAALASSNGVPTPMHAVRLTPMSPAWQLAADRAVLPPPPRARQIETVGDADPLSDVAATSLPTGSVVSWLTYFDPAANPPRLTTPAPDGRFEPLRAQLSTRRIPEHLGDAPPAQTISLRARSLGGAALAPDPAVGDALLAWAALDDGKPQVFVTLVDRDGKKIRQRMLTHAPGEKSDVTMAFAVDGWIVAWVDERTKSEEIVLTKVNRALTTVVPERAVSVAPSAATGPAVCVRDKRAWIAWADARDVTKPGWASIYLARVGAADGGPLGKPTVVFQSELHAFAPVLEPFGDAMAIAWLEGNPKAMPDAPVGGIRIGRLDAAGHFVEPPVYVTVDGRTLTSLAVSCAADRCHVVASAGVGDRAELLAFDFMPGQATRPTRLVGLNGPALAPAYPAFADSDLFYGDLSSDGRGRVRHMRIDWP